MQITFISDTHTATPKLPGGDILIHAGDLTYHGREGETVHQLEWLASSGYKHIIITPGNHEVLWERGKVAFLEYCADLGITCLVDSGIEINGINIYGSPRTPVFGRWAYMHYSNEIKEYWDAIPDNTDILITHGPPYGVLDENTRGDHCGCPLLLDAIKRVRPKIHVFGHIHEGYGEKEESGTLFMNASIMDVMYNPINSPITYCWSDK